MTKGYLVVIYCDKETDLVISKKKFHIDRGYYVYVGSCGVNCAKRVSRHLLETRKKLHWHIDYLTLQCEPLLALILPVEEKKLAKILSTRYNYVPGFGSTDDKNSPSHLFKLSLIELLDLIRGINEESLFTTSSKDEYKKDLE